MKVEFTDYALGRIHMRDILIEEVLDVVKLPQSVHRRSKHPGRWEVRGTVAEKKLLVIYRKLINKILVINAMWE